jgi:hypothetical protein
MSIADLPEGEKCSDSRWQYGYHAGINDEVPTSTDPVYVSGWVTGQMGQQISEQEAIESYYKITV